MRVVLGRKYAFRLALDVRPQRTHGPAVEGGGAGAAANVLAHIVVRISRGRSIGGQRVDHRVQVIGGLVCFVSQLFIHLRAGVVVTHVYRHHAVTPGIGVAVPYPDAVRGAHHSPPAVFTHGHRSSQGV